MSGIKTYETLNKLQDTVNGKPIALFIGFPLYTLMIKHVQIA